jgi:hypothetical protein
MTIERIEHCDEETFRDHLRTGTPLVITGLVRQWPAFGKWTPDYLADACGDRPITVSEYAGGKALSGHVRLTARAYLDRLRGDPGAGQCYYMETNRLSELSEGLYQDLAFPGFLEGLPEADDLIFFGLDVGSCCHIHPHHEAVTFQILGKKTFTLYHPRDARNLYLGPFYGDYRRSRIDFSAIDHARFPRARRLVRYDVELQAGEALYIPVQWAHWTHGHGLNFSVTRFFLSSVRRYHFPSPGLTCLLGDFFHRRLLPSWVGRRLVGPLLGAS